MAMNFIVVLIVIIAFIGASIALYEWFKKKVLLKHDLNLKISGQTDADRELHRSSAAMRDKFMFDHLQ